MEDYYNNINFEDYNEVIKIMNLEELSQIERMLEVLCYLTDSDHWDDESFKTVVEEFKKISFLKDNFKFKSVDVNNIKFKELIPYPINKTTLAEWIDLTSSLSNNKLENIIALRLRKYKEDEWGNIIYEPYEYSLSERSKYVIDIEMNDAYSIIEEFKQYSENVTNAYRELFVEEDSDNLTEDEKEGLTPEEIKQIEEDIKKEKEKSRFTWQILLDTISNGDWSKIPELLKLPINFVFSMLLVRKKFSN